MSGEEEASTSSGQRGPIFTSHFPLPTPMNTKGDQVNNWDFFKQQWEDYEVATGLYKQDPRIRLATLRSVMGKECLQIFLNLKLSEEEKNDVNMCIKLLEAYFKPKRNVVYERYLFNSCTQGPEETVDGYVNRLRKCASSCQFGPLTEELIRDRLVLGLREHSTKLLKEDSLDLNKALNICRSSEIASSQLKVMSLVDKKSNEEINEIRDRKPKPQRKPSDKHNNRRSYRTPSEDSKRTIRRSSKAMSNYDCLMNQSWKH